jgi:hypothetical protein
MARVRQVGLLVAIAMVATAAHAEHATGLHMRDTLPAPREHAEVHGRVTVFLDRNGEVAADGVRRTLPPFGGTDEVWNHVVACIRKRYAPFDLALVTAQPDAGPYIHAVVGGLASQRGYDDKTTAGIGPMNGDVIPDATVYVFSQVVGEGKPEQLCRAAAHEIGHALGLDHERQCGDVMSYCDLRSAGTFMDVDVPCGEDEDRDCAYGKPRQNSYRRLVEHVGLRHAPEPEDPYAGPAPIDPYGPPKREAPKPAPKQKRSAPIDPYR